MRNYLTLTTAAFAALAVGGAIPALANQDHKASAGPAQSFMREAAIGGMAEVELGDLAATRASSPDVKAFAKRMVADHTKANDELRAVAAKEHVKLPDAIDSKHQSELDRLSALSGPAFDKAYMDEMTADHVQDVDAFKKAARGKDPEVAHFAARTLPTLEEHLKEAKKVQAEVGARAASRTDASREASR